MLLRRYAHSEPLPALLIAALIVALPCSLASADITGPFGGGSVDDLDGAHTVQEGTEDPSGTGEHTVQEGTAPTIPVFGDGGQWDIGFNIPAGLDTSSLTLEQTIALQLGFVEFSPTGEMHFVEDWAQAAFLHYGFDQDLITAIGKLSSWELSNGNLTDFTGITLDPRTFMQSLIDSGVTFAPPVDPNLPTATGDVPAPGSLVLLVIGGAMLGRQRRRRPA